MIDRVEIDGDLNDWSARRGTPFDAQSEERPDPWPEQPERLAADGDSGELRQFTITKSGANSVTVSSGVAAGVRVAETELAVADGDEVYVISDDWVPPVIQSSAAMPPSSAPDNLWCWLLGTIAIDGDGVMTIDPNLWGPLIHPPINAFPELQDDARVIMHAAAPDFQRIARQLYSTNDATLLIAEGTGPGDEHRILFTAYPEPGPTGPTGSTGPTGPTGSTGADSVVPGPQGLPGEVEEAPDNGYVYGRSALGWVKIAPSFVGAPAQILNLDNTVDPPVWVEDANP